MFDYDINCSFVEHFFEFFTQLFTKANALPNVIKTRNKSITSKAMQYRQDVGSLYQEDVNYYVSNYYA